MINQKTLDIDRAHRVRQGLYELRVRHPFNITNPRDVREAYEVGAITREEMVEALWKCEN